ncbi:hypothetical protein CXB51_015038 [Gossypium anomalum]|uniref:Reverse transcriptase Ty1/copia-type domain-containing protein n=1 Tax=Gossypium anomalum TaxID=47600 RepID=A0A8J6D1S4_9ROSI|nr:hypothetical protein CXB51_015038 [Gossypium anomalum]
MVLLPDERLSLLQKDALKSLDQLRQVDVNNAFLNGDLDNDVFMHQPLGYEQYDSRGNRFVCRLKKALYILRQAPRAWLEKLKQFLVSVGFVVSKSYASLFFQLLNSEFSLKDMGDLHYFLGIEVTRSSGCLHLCQKKYIHDILDRCSMTMAKSVHTLMVSSSTLAKSDGECLEDPTEYRSLAGALQYVVLTRPDIVFSSVCSVFLVGYVDANWGLDFDDRRSTSEYCVYFGQNLVSWCSKKQQVVSRSTTEAEYKSLAAATSEVTWLLSLLQELQIKSDDTPNVWCDSSSAVAVAANPILYSKFKHVELDLFFVREKVTNRSIMVGEVPACYQVANVLSKPLSMTYVTRF